jgi:hypothetical protein
MNFNDHFEHIAVLTQRARVDRRYLFEQGADFSFKWFYAIEDESPHASFNKSQIAMLLDFVDTGKETAILFEDDATFRHMDRLDEIMAEMPKAWDIIYFGANLRPYPDHPAPIKVTDHIFRVTAAYTTHAVAYTADMAASIIEMYHDGIMYDTFLSDTILPHYSAYVTYPFLSFQRPTRSDLWDRNVDYTDTFTASEDYLRELI